MRNPQQELIILLQEKEQADPAQIHSKQEAIRIVADQLRQDLAIDNHLDAAIAYYVAGYYVRAARLISETDISNETHPAQRWLAFFFLKRFDSIKDQVRAIAADDSYSDQTLQQEILHKGLADYEALDRAFVRKLADILDQFIEFVHNGDEEALKLIQSNLFLCARLAVKAQEWRWWWWIECVRLVIDEFNNNCLWTQLKPMRQESGADQIVAKYIAANYKRSNPVVELWRTQVESLGKINDPDRCSFCLAVPTSAGKTRVAELAILRFFLDYCNDPYAKCVYIAPLRKLASEVEETLAGAFSSIIPNHRVVSTFYGGQEIDMLDQDELASARVLIVTPEKLDGMLRQDPKLLSQIRLVIADEGHLIGEGHTAGDRSYRGYRYRMLLERLVYTLRIKHIPTEVSRPRLLFISGVLPNVDEFAELITGDRLNKVCMNWRPVDEPLKGSWTWDGKKLITSNPRLPEPRTPFDLQECRSADEFEQVVARTAFTCAQNSHTMVFSASKKAITSATLLNLLVYLVNLSPLDMYPLPPKLLRRRQFGEYYTLLERGVAVHHGGLPADLRRETEARIDAGRIRLLFASPTLAQGVNIPFDAVLVYRLHYWRKVAIPDTIFWNVVGRVGRPIATRGDQTAGLNPPRVIFLLNRSATATAEDRQDIRISTALTSREKQYRVATPFLAFLNQLRKEWEQSTGQPIAELVRSLAEQPDLQWMVNHSQWRELSSLLRLLDEHLTALIEESGLYTEEAADWLQNSSRELVNLLVQATTIKPEDLEFIKEAVLARAAFIVKNIPKSQRRQDYLLGLPFEDCEEIRAKQDVLLRWYQGCEGIFACNFDSGIDMLVQLLNFVSSLSICKKWRSKRVERLPLLDVPEISVSQRCALFKSWISGEDAQVVTSELKKVHPDTEFDEYREEMFERSLAWGISAICRFLNDLGQESGLKLTKDLDYLPALVKYGVPRKLACHLVRLGIPRKDAVQIADLHTIRSISADISGPSFVPSMFAQAQQAIISLTDNDITSLSLSETTIQRVKGLRNGMRQAVKLSPREIVL
jgi:hypothetical protein